MTTMEMAAAWKAGKITDDEFHGYLNAGQKTGRGLTVSINKSGGVYIRHPKFVAHSSKKDKDYVAGINLDAGVAKALFGSPEVYNEIAKEVMALVG